MISYKINPHLDWYFGIHINMDIQVGANFDLTEYGARMSLTCLLPFQPKMVRDGFKNKKYNLDFWP